MFFPPTVFALALCISRSIAFIAPQPLSSRQQCDSFHRLNERETPLPVSPTSTLHSSTHLQAKPSKKSKSGGGSGGFGTKGGFGSPSSKSSSSSTSSQRADQTKTRTVSGYTGSGTKALASAANNFDTIRKKFGKDATVDVYVRSPLNDERTFWFVGKVIRVIPPPSDDENTENINIGISNDDLLEGTVYPTEFESIISQKRLILEYAKNQLRPQNMSGPYSAALELWMAPGDSEMDVVQNKVTLIKVTGSTKELREGFHVKDVGYNPEIYVGEEKEKGGLRVVRDEEGRPVKPVFEIN